MKNQYEIAKRFLEDRFVLESVKITIPEEISTFIESKFKNYKKNFSKSSAGYSIEKDINKDLFFVFEYFYDEESHSNFVVNLVDKFDGDKLELFHVYDMDNYKTEIDKCVKKAERIGKEINSKL